MTILISKLPHGVSELITVTSSYGDVIESQSVELTDAIQGDLVTVSNKFLELVFVTRTARDDILSKQGNCTRDKANQLL